MTIAILILNVVILAGIIGMTIDTKNLLKVQRESLDKYKKRKARYDKNQTLKAALTIESEDAADKESGDHGY